MQTANSNLNTNGNIVNGTHLVFKDENTHAKIQKHIADINDEITDQDILNIKTEMSTVSQSEFEIIAENEGFAGEELHRN